MEKNNKKTIIIFIIILVVAVLLFTQLKPSSPKIPAGKSQGGLSLTACVSDSQGNCITQDNTFAVVTFEGETPIVGAQYITIFSTLVAGGTAPFISINDVTGTPNVYGEAIDSQMTTSFQLNNGQTDVQQVTFDVTDARILLGLTNYEMTISATFKDALGNDVILTPIPQADVNILKEKDTCDDNTPWGECSTNKPKFCEPGQLYQNPENPYIQGVIIDKASVCGCPEGYIVNGEICSLNACSDGTIVGQCVNPAPEDSSDRYCDNTKTLVEKCGQCGCADDYYGAPSTGCSVTDTCEYTEYTGTLDLTIGSGSTSTPGDTGWVSPGIAINGIFYGIFPWIDYNKIYSSDNQYAYFDSQGLLSSNYLIATNFGFNIPDGAIITGIEVSMEKKADFNNEVRDDVVKLVKSGSVVGDNKASSVNWVTTEETTLYGGSSDLWGLSLTESDVESSNFGVALSARIISGGGYNTPLVDAIKVKVYYI